MSRELYFKAANLNNKNSELSATRLQKNIVLLQTSLRGYIDFSRDRLKPNDSDGTGDKGAAAQHCSPPFSDCHLNKIS